MAEDLRPEIQPLQKLRKLSGRYVAAGTVPPHCELGMRLTKAAPHSSRLALRQASIGDEVERSMHSAVRIR